MYLLPQEIEVWYIIPAIRRELSKIFTKKYGWSYEKAGNILGVSKAAVSQYLKNKRAKSVKFPLKIKKQIEKSAEKIRKNERVVVKEIMRLIDEMKKTRCSCKVCEKYNKGILKICKQHPIKRK